MDTLNIRPIAYVRTDFPEKFGIPRQSGIIPELTGRIVFEPEFRDRNALREIEKYSHLWLIWGFSENITDEKNGRWSPTIRPPRLGGNKRVGVFASRSPFRPNPLGLSVVKLDRVEPETSEGPVLFVSGVDMVDGTPIYDIKPYLKYVDSIPEACDGFALTEKRDLLEVKFSEKDKDKLSERDKNVIARVLAQDPRPQYQNEGSRIYKMSFGEYEIGFRVEDNIVHVESVETR